MKKYFVIPIAFFSVVLWSQVAIADSLNLSKSDGLSQGECVVSGEKLTYTICYNNPNSYDVNDVVLIDVLPDKADFISAGNGGAYDTISHTVTWTIGSLAQKIEDPIETCVELKINVTALPGTAVTNRVTIDSSNEESPLVVDKPTVKTETTGVCPVAVYVDIKPGGCPTPINVGSKGVLPVAV